MDTNVFDYDVLSHQGVSPEWVQCAKELNNDIPDETWLRMYDNNGLRDIVVEPSEMTEFTVCPNAYNTSGQDAPMYTFNIKPQNQVCGIKTKSITFSQKNLRFTVSGNLEEAFKAAYPEVKQFTVNSEADWEKVNISDWIEMNPENGDGSDFGTTIDLLANSDNPLLVGREGYIVLKLKDNKGVMDSDVTKTIPVFQKAYVLSVDPAEIIIPNEPSADGEPAVFSVTSSGAWNVLDSDNIPAWVMAESAQGGIGVDGPDNKNPESLSYRVSNQNPYLSERIAEMKIKPDDTNNNNVLDINIRQLPFLWQFDMAENKLATRAGSYDSNITASGEWHIEVEYEGDEHDWLKFEEVAGEKCEEPHMVKYSTVGDNLSEQKRHAVVTVISDRHQNNPEWPELKTVYNIEQRGIIFALEGDESSEVTTVDLTFDAFDAEDQTVKVLSSHPWEAKAPTVNWISLPGQTGGEADGILSLKVANNFSTKNSRSGAVTLVSEYPKHKECVVHVTQKAFDFSVDRTRFENIPAYVGNGAKYQVNLKSSAGWTISGRDWVSAPASGNKNEEGETVEFTVSNNPNYTARTADVQIVSSENGKGDINPLKITFKQNKFEFDCTADSFTFDPIDNSSKSFDVICNGPWNSAVSGYNIIHLSKTGGVGSEENRKNSVSVTVDGNSSQSQRTSSITISNTLNSDIKQIKITQNPYVWNPGSLSENELPALDPETRSFQFECWGGWKVSLTYDDQDRWDGQWPSLSIDGAENNFALFGNNAEDSNKRENVTIKFKKNTNTVSRTVNVRVKSTDFPALEKSWNITQSQFYFDTRSGDGEFTALNPKEGSVSLSRNTMGGWEVNKEADWITLETTYGENGGTVNFTVKDNIDQNERIANIVITSNENSTLQKIYKVKQKGLTLMVENHDVLFGSEKGAKTLTVTTEDDTWRIENITEPSWLKAEKASGNTIEVHVEANTGKKAVDRQASFDVVCGRNKAIKQTVTVTQSK